MLYCFLIQQDELFSEINNNKGRTLCERNYPQTFFNRQLKEKSHFSAILRRKIFPPAVVSADTRIARLMLPILLR